jgi:hypothetical protein
MQISARFRQQPGTSRAGLERAAFELAKKCVEQRPALPGPGGGVARPHPAQCFLEPLLVMRAED